MRKYLIVIALLFLVLLFPSIGYCACAWTETDTVGTAASCSSTDVADCLDDAECSSGDTIVIPSGTCQWTSRVEVNDELTITGSGTALTETSPTTIQRYGFHIYPGLNNVRITNIIFDGQGYYSYSTSFQKGLAVHIGELSGAYDVGSQNFRIDNNKFKDFYYGTSPKSGMWTIYVKGFSYGVIDNNVFVDNTNAAVVICADGTAARSRSGIGNYTNGTVFIEDNDFSISGDNGYGGTIVSGNNGARYVVRYNTMSDSAGGYIDMVADAHGLCYGCNEYEAGTLSVEIYENTINSVVAGWKRAFHIRGGTGVIYDNTLTGSWGQGIYLTNYRSTGSCGTNCAGVVNEGFTACCSDGEGYPCQDQVNAFYIWDNTDDGSPLAVASATSDIQEDRDYYLSDPGDYTPYTYPHPLTVPGGGAAPVTEWVWPDAGTLGCNDTTGCAADEKRVRIQQGTDEPATCRWSLDGDGGDDTDTAYADLNNEFASTGGTWHGEYTCVACGATSVSFWTRCTDGTNTQSSSSEIIVSIEGLPVVMVPAGFSIEVGGGDKSIDIGTVKSMDIE